jgi:transcriptional repressor NrdR
MLAQTVEETIRATGAAQVEAQEVGLAILGPLRTLDEVAFMRYASVYQGWETLEDFEAAIAVLKVERENQVSQSSQSNAITKHQKVNT